MLKLEDERLGAESENQRFMQVQWFTLNQLKKENVIPSDRWLINNKLVSSIVVHSATMEEDKGLLFDFDLS